MVVKLLGLSPTAQSPRGIGAIRDVLLDGSQSTYLHIYRQSDAPNILLQARMLFSNFPRYALEALGMVGIALVGALLVSQLGVWYPGASSS